MSQIKINKLTFSYEGSHDNIFENVSFAIDTDWKLGFTGRNGRGKTTFLKLLTGAYEYRGTIDKTVNLEYFPYDIRDKKIFTISVAKNILPELEVWQLIKELNKLEVNDDILYRDFDTLSEGERTKVLLAILFLKENCFLLIDEPTNHLDIAGRQIVSRYLNSKRGFILVSHDRDFLDSCVDHILSINKTDINIQKGNFSSWQHNKILQDNFERAENEKLMGEIRRLKVAAARTKGWSEEIEQSKIGDHAFDRGFIGHKAAKMMKQSKSIEARQNQAAEEKIKLLKNIERTDFLKMSPQKHYADKLVIATGLSVSFNKRVIFEDLNFNIEQGDRVAVTGKNGSGKSSILNAVCGNIPYAGSLSLSSRLKISYVQQDTSKLTGNLTDYAKAYDIDESLFKTILIKLDFSRGQFDKNIEDFSAGQKKKVLIARSLSEKAHLYIWDEPLNYIDIFSRIQIEQLIVENSPTLLFVEHDKAFTDNIATKQIILGTKLEQSFLR